jgi:HSP20 family molecular chaperone IbpA
MPGFKKENITTNINQKEASIMVTARGEQNRVFDKDIPIPPEADMDSGRVVYDGYDLTIIFKKKLNTNSRVQ